MILISGTPEGNAAMAYRMARANVRDVGTCLAAAGPDALAWYEDAFKAALNAIAWREEARTWRRIVLHRAAHDDRSIDPTGKPPPPVA